MKIIFETAGGQTLAADLTEEDFTKLVYKVGDLCQTVRNNSIRDVNIEGRVRMALSDFTLHAKERLAE